ncbi:MAG: hypothetical protein ABEJ81_02690 [Haloferacaceae archaeon]
MQRRAAAIYAIVFVLIGTASYTLIATAQQPQVSFANPDYKLSQGDSFQVQGRTYTVSSISAKMESGGPEGGGGGIRRSGELQWTNQSGRYSETWDNGSTVTLDGGDYVVLVPNATNGSSFTLQQTQNRTAILQNDSTADNATVSRNGRDYVVITENGTSRLVPADEYFPAPKRTNYSVGDQIQYKGNATTVDGVTNTSATVAWTAPKQNTVELDDAANATLAGKQYFVYFPDNSTLVLESDYSVYQRQAAKIDRFNEHENGLWGVTALSGGAAILLIGMAYLPSRY